MLPRFLLLLAFAGTALAIPNITTTSLPNGQVGVAYDRSISVAGTQGSVDWAITSGSLPAGLTMNTNSGRITGTPTTAGTSTFTVRATDRNGSDSQPLSITVDPATLTITTSSLPNATFGSAYSQTLQATGGSGTYSWSRTAGALPGGLTLNPNGTITGAPTATGNFNFTVTVTDSANRTAQKALSISVTAPALSVATDSLPNAVVGTAYSQTLQATGGTGGYTWARTAGSLPANLTLNANGTISGTPTAAGASTFTVTVTDNGGRTANKQLTLTVDPGAPTVTTSSLPNGQVGQAYSQNLQASGGSGGYSWTLTAGALPQGVSLNAAGTIAGTPTAAGTANFEVTVRDSGGRTASRSLSIIVAPAAVTVTTSALPNGQVGATYNATLEASGGSGTYVWTLTSGTLPTGLLLAPTGAITGVPLASGARTFSVTATDTELRSASKSLTILIDPPGLSITTASLPNGVVGTPYSATVEATGGSGGNQFTVTSGALPAGLTLSSSGTIAGNPTAAGTANFTVTVQDNGGRSASKALTIAIDPPALTITTASLPNGVVGTPYSGAVEASGGSGGNRFSISAGALPSGLTLAPGGGITGTPTAAGTANFTVTVQDNGGHSASKALTLAIDAPALTITTASLPNAIVGTAYSATVESSGGSGGNRFTVSAGALPAGLSLSQAGGITGTPTAAGTSNLTVTVTDSANKTASKAYTLTVDPPTLTITTTALATGTAGTPYSQPIGATGGSGGYAWSISSGALPPNLTLNTSGTIVGTPSAPGTTSFTVQVKDSANATATKAFTLVVNPPAISITTTTLPPAVEGTAYSQTLNATGGTGGFRWSLAAGSLPAGLTLDPSGRIAGTVTGGSATFTVAVQDSSGTSASRNLSITVTPPLTLPPDTTLPTGVTGTAYSGAIKPSGGQGPFTYSVASGQLPPGLTLNTSTGEIAGRPTQVGNFTFSIQVKDSAGGQAQVSYTVAIANTLTITNPPVLPGGSLNVPYSVTLIAAGGTTPYSFSATAGSLPAGLTFRPDGTIAGTPTSAGVFTVTATVVDAVGGRTSKEFSLTIAATLTITTGPQLPNGIPGSPYNAPLAATGGATPYTWSIASGSLPAGLRLDPATGAITGVPEAPTTANFTIAVTDAASVTAQKAFTLTITPGVTFTSAATLPEAVAGSPYSFTFEATGGRAPYSWRISDGALPGGLSLNATSGVVSGSPSAAGTFNFTVEATDAAGLKATRVHTLVVNLPSVATLRLSGVPATLAPLQQPQVDVVIANPYPVPITGRLNLAFTPATGMPDDPAVQFSSGGRSVTFTIAANDTRATFSVPRLLIQSGSVAGTLQFTVESLRAGNDTLPNPTAPIGSAQVPAAVAIVQTVEVRRTSGGFDLVVVGATTTRELANMTVRFRPPAGATLQTTEVNVPLSDPAKAWFQGNGSAQYGGQFSITLPFTFVGGPSAIESVGVVLSNNVGVSPEVSGPY
jgi:hypothetical protein